MTDKATEHQQPSPPMGVSSSEGLGHKPRALRVTCPYCQSAAKLVGGRAIYPHRPDLAAKRFWQCKPCDAYVGCHEAGNGQGDGTKPLGRLANAELRKAKKDAHYAFDRLWLDAPNRRRARGCRRVFQLVVARKAAGTVA